MKGWERVKALYQFICFCHFVQSVNVPFFFFIFLLHTLKSSWTQYWNRLLKTQHVCGTAQSCLFIQKQSSCSSYVLLSQCIWKFNFNCFFTPVVHGLGQLLPCILFSVPGDIPCYTMCHPTSRVLVLTIRANLEKKICSLYDVMAPVVRLCHCWLLFHLSVAWLLSALLWKPEKWLQHELKLPAEEKTVKYEIVGKHSWTCHPAEVAVSKGCQGIDAKKLQGQWLERIFKIAPRSTQVDERTGEMESTFGADVTQMAWHHCK